MQRGALGARSRRASAALRERAVGIFDRIDRIAEQLGDLIVPDDVRAHVELGAAYLDRGDLDAAVHELSRAVELRPDHPRAQLSARAWRTRGAATPTRRSRRSSARRRRGGSASTAGIRRGVAGARRDCTGGAATTMRRSMPIARRSMPASAIRRCAARSIAASARVYLRAATVRQGGARAAQGGGGDARRRARRRGCSGARLYLTRRLRHGARVPRAGGAGGAARSAGRWRRSAICSSGWGRATRRATRISARSQPTTPRCKWRRARDWRGSSLARGRSAGGARRGAARARARPAATRYPAHARARRTRRRSSGTMRSARTIARWSARRAERGSAGSCMLFDRRGLLEEALRAALRAGADRARAHLRDALARPTRPIIRMRWQRRARAAAEGGELERAQALVDARSPPADIARGAPGGRRRGAQARTAGAAAAALRRAAQLAPDDPRPRARLAEVYRAEREPSARARSLCAPRRTRTA